MRVKLLKDYRRWRAGAEVVPAWEAEALWLIAAGIAVPVLRERKPEPTAEPKAQGGRKK